VFLPLIFSQTFVQIINYCRFVQIRRSKREKSLYAHIDNVENTYELRIYTGVFVRSRLSDIIRWNIEFSRKNGTGNIPRIERHNRYD